MQHKTQRKFVLQKKFSFVSVIVIFRKLRSVVSSRPFWPRGWGREVVSWPPVLRRNLHLALRCQLQRDRARVHLFGAKQISQSAHFGGMKMHWNNILLNFRWRHRRHRVFRSLFWKWGFVVQFSAFCWCRRKLTKLVQLKFLMRLQKWSVCFAQ